MELRTSRFAQARFRKAVGPWIAPLPFPTVPRLEAYAVYADRFTNVFSIRVNNPNMGLP